MVSALNSIQTKPLLESPSKPPFGVVVDSSQNIPFMLHVYYVNILKGAGNETEYNAQS